MERQWTDKRDMYTVEKPKIKVIKNKQIKYLRK